MSDSPQSAATQASAISPIEALLCGTVATGRLDALQPRSATAWTVTHPGLQSLADFPETRQRLRICVATEEIVGPVRNGGIGTTYAALAEMLAQEGHEVTVLYLRGQEVEVETVDHWIADYAAKGVRFVPVPDYAEREMLRTHADRWLRAPYNMMRYLIEHPMDVVHVSEWRGSGYLSLLAKRQKIAFARTLFVVKTSSPWMWNRLYGAHTLDRVDDLAKITAERQSVELADMVIGGSLHLLRWMESQGYAIPQGRTFVQPNVATFATLEPLMRRRSLARGQRTQIDEIVFFGRLEARKGLFVFCQAIRRLIRKGVQLPPRITFMGKPGAKMASHPDQTTPEYIEEVTRHWPTKVSILTEFQQYEAIEYLLGGARLAVMPSIIENSSMAIYEAAICGIPCVATNVGGNAELIHPDDRPHVLCEPHPVSLGDKVEEALRQGGLAPRPSFDNDANLETWRSFHRRLGGPLREALLERAAPPARCPGDDTPGDAGGTSVCIYYTGDAAALNTTLASLVQQEHPALEVRVAVDGDSNDVMAEAAELLGAHGLPCEVVDAFDLDAGAAFNLLANDARGAFLVFLWEGATLDPAAIATLETAAQGSEARLLSWLHRAPARSDATKGALRATIIGSASDAFFRSEAGELPLFVAAAAFRQLGGFTADYRVLGYDHELVARAILEGLRCETILRDLGTVQARSADWLRQRGYDLSASAFRAARPELAAAPLAMRDVLLLGRGLSQRSGGAGRKATDPVKKTESLLARMMAGLAAEPVPVETPAPAPRQRPPLPAPAAPSASAEAMIAAVDKPRTRTSPAGPAKPVTRAGAGGGITNLIDHYAADLLGPAPAPREGGQRKTAPAIVPAPGVPVAAPIPELSSALQSLIERRMAVCAGRVVGQFLGSHEGRLWGWAVDLDRREVPVTVQAIAGGVALDALANRTFAGFAAVPPEVRRSCFVIDPGPRRTRAPLPYRIAGQEGLLHLAQGELPPAAARLRECGIEGFCDPSDTGLIYGWAWCPAMPERHVDIAIYVDGQFFARLRADRDREDLQQRGIGRGDYGFQIMLPRALREAGRHRVDVLVANLGVALSRSPVWAQGQRIDVTEPRKRLRIFQR